MSHFAINYDKNDSRITSNKTIFRYQNYYFDWFLVLFRYSSSKELIFYQMKCPINSKTTYKRNYPLSYSKYSFRLSSRNRIYDWLFYFLAQNVPRRLSDNNLKSHVRNLHGWTSILIAFFCVWRVYFFFLQKTREENKDWKSKIYLYFTPWALFYRIKKQGSESSYHSQQQQIHMQNLDRGSAIW